MLKTITSCPRCRSSLSPLNSPSRGDEQVGNQHDHPAVRLLVGDLGQHAVDVGLFGRVLRHRAPPGWRAGGCACCARARPCRTAASKLVSPTESCCRKSRYARLAATAQAYSYLLSGLRPELHRLADVDQQRAPQVGFFFVLLDVVLVGLRPDLPVDAARIVAGDVFAVLHELDRLPEIRAAVQARQKSLDDVPSLQFQPRNPRDGLRLQKSSGIAGHASARLPSRGFPEPAARSPCRPKCLRSRPRSW